MPVTTEALPSLRRKLLASMVSFPILLAAVSGTCVYMLVPRSTADPDIWWHLRNAQYQLTTRAFIRSDLYSFTTAGASWINHEWLAELPFYLGWRLLGERGLYVVTLLAIECIFLGVFLLACRHSKNPKPALLATVIGALLATVSYGPRTLLFGWMALVAELLILERFMEASPRTLDKVQWMLPLLFAIWVNTHGSWLIGMVILFTFLIAGYWRMQVGRIESDGWSSDQLKALTTAAAFSLASLLLNPYGWRLVAYPFNLGYRQKLNIANVEEWYSLDFHSPRGHIFLVSLSLVFLAQLCRSRKWHPYELAWMFIGVYAAFTYSRFLFLAAILIFPLVAKDIPGLSPYRPERDKPWLNAFVLCILVCMVARHLGGSRGDGEGADTSFPGSALPFLETFRPAGNVFNEYLWGGYLDWHLRQIPVFVDSRVDIFEYAGVFKDYLDATRLKDTLFILDKYKIRYVLFQPDAPIIYFLEHTRQWKIDYQDGSAVLLERATPLQVPDQGFSTACVR